MVKKSFTVNWLLGMCLKENYSDSPSNEYSLHYSAEHLFCDVKIWTQNQVKSKKKIITPVKVLNSIQKSGAEQKKGQNDNAIMLCRVSINTRTSNVLILGRVLGLDSAHPYWPYCKLKLCIILACQCKEKLRCTIHFLNCINFLNCIVLLELYHFLLWTWTGTL